MRPLLIRDDLEKQIVAELKKQLQARGWLVNKVHGSAYAKGWPDLYLAHPRYGQRWVEVKKPGGSLELTQIRRFRLWTAAGINVYVVSDATEATIRKLEQAGPGNWHWWMDTKLKPKTRERVRAQPKKKRGRSRFPRMG